MDPCHNIPFCGVADPVAAGTHLLGFGATLAAAVQLWQRSTGRVLLRASLAAFVLGSVAVFGASTAYHTFGAEPLRSTLRRLDHAAIFLLIAGTFTPIVANLTRGWLRAFVLSTVWALALCGVAEKIFLGPEAVPEWLDVTLFLSLGWFGIVPARALVHTHGLRVVLWLPFAGALYSAGALCELFGWPVIIPGVFGFHEVFHLFVLAGCGSFFLFIRRHVAHAPHAPPLPVTIDPGLVGT